MKDVYGRTGLEFGAWVSFQDGWCCRKFLADDAQTVFTGSLLSRFSDATHTSLKDDRGDFVVCAPQLFFFFWNSGGKTRTNRCRRFIMRTSRCRFMIKMRETRPFNSYCKHLGMKHVEVSCAFTFLILHLAISWLLWVHLTSGFECANCQSPISVPVCLKPHNHSLMSPSLIFSPPPFRPLFFFIFFPIMKTAAA